MNLPNGWLQDPAAQLLRELVKETKGVAGAFVEVGSYHGRSAIVIGTEVRKLKGKLYCVDTWNGPAYHDVYDKLPANRRKYIWEGENNPFGKFMANITAAKLKTTVKPIMGASEAVLSEWDRPLRFVYIDGCHYYDFVKKDAGWRKHLVKGGIIAFHDYTNAAWPEVRKAVDEVMNADNEFEVVYVAYSIKAFRRI